MAKTSKKAVKQTETTEVTSLDKCVKDYQNFEPETSKSEMIRTLFAKGHSKADIAKAMQIRYQHVRNVLITPLKRPVADKLAK